MKDIMAMMVPKTISGKYNHWLVVWNIVYFLIQLGIVVPTDFHIFQRG